MFTKTASKLGATPTRVMDGGTTGNVPHVASSIDLRAWVSGASLAALVSHNRYVLFEYRS